MEELAEGVTVGTDGRTDQLARPGQARRIASAIVHDLSHALFKGVLTHINGLVNSCSPNKPGNPVFDFEVRRRE